MAAYWWCPCISVVPEATHKARLSALEGPRVSSKSPSKVRDGGKGVARRNRREKCFPLTKGHSWFAWRANQWSKENRKIILIELVARPVAKVSPRGPESRWSSTVNETNFWRLSLVGVCAWMKWLIVGLPSVMDLCRLQGRRLVSGVFRRLQQINQNQWKLG